MDIVGVNEVANTYTARKLFDEGVASYVKGHFGRSVELFTRAIRFDSNFALFYVSRGAANLKLERVKDAIADFNHAIELDPKYARAYHLRGLAYEKSGEIARAFRDFDRSLECDPEYLAAYHSRDSMLSNPGHIDFSEEEHDIIDHLTAMRLAQFDRGNIISDQSI